MIISIFQIKVIHRVLIQQAGVDYFENMYKLQTVHLQLLQMFTQYEINVNIKRQTSIWYRLVIFFCFDCMLIVA